MTGEALSRTALARARDLAVRPLARPVSRPIAAGLAFVAAAGYVALVDPNEAGHYPTCPMKAWTGLSCPGCGSLRALHALTHGDLSTAVSHNVLAVVALPVLVAAWLAWTRRAATGRRRTWVVPVWAIRLLVAVIAAFFVARNWPGVTWLGR